MKYLLLVSFLVSASAFGKTILFLGDSLTEGYQLAKEEAYPAVVEKELKKIDPTIKVINGGVSGATSASGIRRLDWYLKAKPDIMVLALGANDGLRGLKISETEKNLSQAIEKGKSLGIKVIIAGMKMPTNYGEPYRTNFESMYPKLAKTHKIKLIPFMLEGVGGNSKLNLPDGIHPNAQGYIVIAKTMVNFLKDEI